MVLRKRIVWIVATVLLVMTLGTLGYVVSGSSAVESWVGSQLLEIAGSYLGPTLRFQRLTYLRPRTIVLDHLTLSCPDPADATKSVTIFTVKRARLELTEVPRRGQPIRFSQVVLEGPEIHAIASTPGGTSLVGFSNLIKDSVQSSLSNVSTRPAPMKLSDFLLIHHIEIVDGGISYDPRKPDMPPLWLDSIGATLDFDRAATLSDPAVYNISTHISRKPAFQLDLQGQVNIDTFTVELANLGLTLDLQEKNAHFLPPELQKMLHDFEVTGQLRLKASGTLPLANWRQSTLQCGGELTTARVAWGATRLSVDQWNWQADVARADSEGGSVVNIRKSEAHLLGGEFQLRGMIPLDGDRPAQLDITASNLQIQQLLRANSPDELPSYAGNLGAQITYAGPLAKWNEQAQGSGTISVRKGRIANMPVLGRIITDVSKTVVSALGGRKQALSDSLDGSFRFAGDNMQVDRFAGTAGTLAFRGSGTIGFNQRLDLHLNAGPLESLQNSLGSVGRLWASASDALAGYRVGGTFDDPQVSMEIGGGH